MQSTLVGSFQVSEDERVRLTWHEPDDGDPWLAISGNAGEIAIPIKVLAFEFLPKVLEAVGLAKRWFRRHGVTTGR